MAVISQKRAIAQFEQLPLCRDPIRALVDLGHLYHALGQTDQTIRLYQAAIDLAAQHGDPYHQAHILLGLSWIYQEAGRLDECLDLYEASHQIFEQQNMPFDQAVMLQGIAWIYVDIGRQRDALCTFQQALALIDPEWHAAEYVSLLTASARLQSE
jgi:tetratricopeptide (TPR) repeat protein